MTTSAFPIPPQALRFMNDSEERFIEIGDDVVARIDSIKPLGSIESALDVGCGYGRIAHALMRRDAFAGSYLGFDTLARHIEWCVENLTPASGGRFRFQHLNIKNDRYNPGGTIAAEDVTFPAEADTVDLVILTSVFTHMFPDDIRRYLTEVARVMRPGALSYATAFVIDDAFLDGSNRVPLTGTLPFRLRGYCRYGTEEDPLHRIAYDERWLDWAIEDVGLRLERVELGQWRDHPDGRGTQDLLVILPA